MTHGELAERTGMTQNHISRVESDRYDVRIGNIETILNAMGYTMDFLKMRGAN